MTNLEKVLFVLLFAAVIVIGVVLYNMNSNMAEMDRKGRELRQWAAITAKWADHVARVHIAEPSGVAWDHIQPPPDPPPGW